MIVLKCSPTFKKTRKFFEDSKQYLNPSILHKYGRIGVERLMEYTPKLTGKTANSWSYDIIRSNNRIDIVWKNSNIVDGVPIAVILQYGHGTRNGGYVHGRDYINPAIRPIFDRIVEDIGREVQS